jgi:uncharacterized protein (DUF1697 family)
VTRYVAFLRAINVGGHVVKMEKLRALFEAMGAANVETFIASGNVIFDTPRRDPAALERHLEAGLRQGLGYEVATFLRTLPEVAAVAAHAPFGPSAAEADAQYVGFLKSAPAAPACAAVAACGNASHELLVHNREIYWLRRNRLLELTGSGLEKALVGGVTFRNVTTVRKIAARWKPGPVKRR